MHLHRELSRAILVVEDDEGIRSGLQELLESEGYLVHAADNGQRALELLERLPRPGLVFLDLFMPVMNGAEFLGQMSARYSELLAALPIVILSAAPPDCEAAMSAKRFARAFLTKPVKIDHLLEVASQYCGGGAP